MCIFIKVKEACIRCVHSLQAKMGERNNYMNDKERHQ